MLVSPDKAHAEQVLDGIRWASELLGVPVLGGHLTLGHAPALSASCTGFTTAPLTRQRPRPGDVLLAAFAVDGRYMSDTNDFFTALRDRRPSLLKTDGEALVEVAERGLCHAARDISMPGVAGSLLQMIEGAGVGATLDVDAVPRPVGVAIERWLLTFPSFGFLLAAPEEHVDAAVRKVPRARPGVRAVRALRRHQHAQARVRRRDRGRVGPRGHPAHRAIAIGWCMTPR